MNTWHEQTMTLRQILLEPTGLAEVALLPVLDAEITCSRRVSAAARPLIELAGLVGVESSSVE